MALKTQNMIQLIIYLIGCFATFLMFRSTSVSDFLFYKDDSWLNFAIKSFFILMSWVGLVVTLIMSTVEKISNMEGKAPNWFDSPKKREKDK